MGKGGDLFDNGSYCFGYYLIYYLGCSEVERRVAGVRKVICEVAMVGRN